MNSEYLEFDRAGALMGGFGIVQDITARKQAEQSLLKAKEELGTRVRERTEELSRTVEKLREEVEARIAAQQALERTQLILNETQFISKIGGWEYDVVTGRVTWTDEVYPLFFRMEPAACAELVEASHPVAPGRKTESPMLAEAPDGAAVYGVIRFRFSLFFRPSLL